MINNDKINEAFSCTKDRRSTLKSTILLLLLLGFNYVFSFAWQAYLTRVLGADVYGHVFLADKLLLCFAYLFDLGYFLLGAGSWQLDKTKRQQVFNAIFVLKLLTACVTLGCLLIIERLGLLKVSANYSCLVYIFFVALLIEKLLPDFVYRAEHRMLYLLTCNLCSRVCLLAWLVLFVKQADDYMRIPVVYALAAALLLTLVLLDLEKRGQLKFEWVKLEALKNAFFKSLHLAGAKLANCVFNCLTVLALHFADKDNRLLSYFLLLDLLFITGRKVLNTLGESFYLHLHKRADYKWYAQVALALAVLMLLLLSLLYWQAETVLGILFGAEFIAAASYLRLFLWAALPACLSALLAYPYLATKNKLKSVNLAFFCGTFFYALALLYLVLSGDLRIVQILRVYTLSVYVEFFINCCAVLVYNRQNREARFS